MYFKEQKSNKNLNLKINETIINANKKFIQLQSNNQIQQETDLKPFISRARYFLLLSQFSKNQETLCIFIQNISTQLIFYQNFRTAEQLIKGVLQFTAFLSAYTQSLLLGAYSEVLMGLNKIKESKNYCLQSIKLIEEDVHKFLRNLKRKQKKPDATQKKLIRVLLLSYLRLIRVLKLMETENLPVKSLPSLKAITKKGIRMNTRYLFSPRLSRAFRSYEREDRGLKINGKGKLERSTVSTSLPAFKQISNSIEKKKIVIESSGGVGNKRVKF